LGDSDHEIRLRAPHPRLSWQSCRWSSSSSLGMRRLPLRSRPNSSCISRRCGSSLPGPRYAHRLVSVSEIFFRRAVQCFASSRSACSMLRQGVRAVRAFRWLRWNPSRIELSCRQAVRRAPLFAIPARRASPSRSCCPRSRRHARRRFASPRRTVAKVVAIRATGIAKSAAILVKALAAETRVVAAETRATAEARAAAVTVKPDQSKLPVRSPT
jgi:hypothetical protein